VPGSGRKRMHQFLFVFFAIVLLIGCFTPFSRNFFGLPAYQHVLVGEPLAPSFNLPTRLDRVLQWQVGRPAYTGVLLSDRVPVVQRAGEYFVSLKLFGLIPLRHMMVVAVPEVKVVPGGQSIGVLLHSEGVMVVGEAPIQFPGGQAYSPAQRAGIQEGDIILAINGQQVYNEADIREIINEVGGAGEKLDVRVKRNGCEFHVYINPGYCQKTGRYRVGLLVRDSTAGVGTLTFYEPESRFYGALGHLITDMRTSKGMELRDGSIIEAEIRGIRPGTRGRPGEKLGVFSDRPLLSGSIEQNTVYGIFGTMDGEPNNPLYQTPVPVGLLHHIRPGPAEMLTVLRGCEIERFALVIEEVRPEAVADGKGLVIRVTDERLLRGPGGIIQGMSGSPILQNGRVVGAVTHVFINNPARGYGVPLEWMLRECGLLRPTNNLPELRQAS